MQVLTSVDAARIRALRDRDGFFWLDPRDIGDHLAQVAGVLTRRNDDLAGLTSTFFDANAGRLNRLATRLTVMATFLLIWTLVIPTVAAAVDSWRRRKEWW